MRAPYVACRPLAAVFNASASFRDLRVKIAELESHLHDLHDEIAIKAEELRVAQEQADASTESENAATRKLAAKQKELNRAYKRIEELQDSQTHYLQQPRASTAAFSKTPDLERELAETREMLALAEAQIAATQVQCESLMTEMQGERGTSEANLCTDDSAAHTQAFARDECAPRASAAAIAAQTGTTLEVEDITLSMSSCADAAEEASRDQTPGASDMRAPQDVSSTAPALQMSGAVGIKGVAGGNKHGSQLEQDAVGSSRVGYIAAV